MLNLAIMMSCFCLVKWHFLALVRLCRTVIDQIKTEINFSSYCNQDDGCNVITNWQRMFFLNIILLKVTLFAGGSHGT